MDARVSSPARPDGGGRGGGRGQLLSRRDACPATCAPPPPRCFRAPPALTPLPAVSLSVGNDLSAFALSECR